MFERDPVADPTGYPFARRKRGGPIVEVDPEIAAFLEENTAPPRSRVFPWLMTAITNTRRSVSTPLLQGPAILRRFSFTLDSNPDPPVVSVEVGWALNPVNEAGVAVATLKPYTVLTELLNPFGVGTLGAGQGYPAFSSVNTHVEWETVEDFIILEPRFCFVAAIHNNGGFTSAGRGWMSVLEGVSPAALRAFTGS
jgi:hypothetical protein